jgi:hypothetical protein
MKSNESDFRHALRNGACILFCPHWLVWRFEVQHVAPVAKAESRREFALAAKSNRLVELLRAGHQFTGEEADDSRRIVARTGNTG